MMYKFYIYRLSDESYRDQKEDWILLHIPSIYKVENNGSYKTLFYHVAQGVSYVNVLIPDDELHSIFSIMPYPKGVV